MAKTSYIASAMKPEEVPVCTALDVGSYPLQYLEKVKSILGDIKSEELKRRVENTLGSFESGADGKLAQSSPYKLVVLQEILPKGKVIAFRPRLQIAKKGDPNFMNGFYVDFGLNLVSSSEDYKVNQIPSEALASDLKQTGIDLKDAKLIPYWALTKEVVEGSSTGLVFRLSNEGKDIAKDIILNTSDFEWNYQPSNSGLFRAYLNSSGNWYASDGNLADSDDCGRVVVETTGEASASQFEVLRKKSEELFARQTVERKNLADKLLR